MRFLQRLNLFRLNLYSLIFGAAGGISLAAGLYVYGGLFVALALVLRLIRLALQSPRV